MVRLFVRPDEEILNLIERGIEKCNGNLLKFSKEINICRTTVYHWFEQKIWIDIEKFRNICKYLGLNYENYLIEKQVHSTRSDPEIFNKDWFKINSNISLLLGWICTEGYIPKKNSCRVTISQNDVEVLKKLESIIRLEYPINNKIIIRSDKNKENKRLEISSPMFWYVLVNHFKIPEGKKNFIVSVPKQIFDSNKECKRAFLTATFEGDGSWPPDTINIRMTSKDYVISCYKLLKELKYNTTYARLSQENTWIVQLSSKKDICRFVYENTPYFLAKNKLEYFSMKKFLEDYLYKNHYIKVDWMIIKKIKIKLNLRLSELRDLIEKETGYNYKTKYLKDWIGYRKCRENLKIRLPVLTLFSRILNNPKIVPDEYSWIEEVYKTRKFESLRNIYEIRSNGTIGDEIKRS